MWNTFWLLLRESLCSRSVWATQVAGLLCGKALAAYVALTPEDAVVYDTMKGAILKRHEINEETYISPMIQNKSQKGREVIARVCGSSWGSFFLMGC